MQLESDAPELPPSRRIFTVAEACEYLKCGRAAILGAYDRGELVGRDISPTSSKRSIRFTESALQEYINPGKPKPVAVKRKRRKHEFKKIV